MAYKVTKPDGVRTLFNGRFYPYGSTIGPHAMPPSLWQSLIDEGAIVSDGPFIPPAEIPQPENPLEYAQELPNLSDVVSPEMVPALAGVGVNSTADLVKVPESELTKIKGVGPATVRKWKEGVK